MYLMYIFFLSLPFSLPVDFHSLSLSRFPCTRKFTEEVIEHHTVSELWDDFGIVTDVIVWI